MVFLKRFTRCSPLFIMPYDFVELRIASENFIQYKANVAIHPPITMHINTPILRQQIPHQHQPLINHGDERVRALAPCVPISQFFYDTRLFGEGVAADLNIHGKIRAHVKRRINVNQLDAALFFNLFTKRSVFQTR